MKETNWSEFKISDLFIIDNKSKKVQIPTGTYVRKNYLLKGITPRITVTSQNNGIDAYYSSNDKNYRVFENFISVSFLGTVFYHQYKASIDMKVHCLKLKDCVLNFHLSMFLISEIKKSIDNASYGNQLSSTDLPHKKILLPVTEDGEPDYDFMEAYIKEREAVKRKQYLDYIKEQLEIIGGYNLIPLADKQWKSFYISDEIGNGIFKLRASLSGIDKNKLVNCKELNIPYITRSDFNNGIAMFVGNEQKSNYKMDVGNVITIGLDTQTVFYQPYPFYTGQNIQVLYNEHLNKYVAKFIIPLLKMQVSKLSWGGNGATLGRLKRMQLFLPVTNDNEPDYEYMEAYIKNLLRKKIQDYLDYVKS